MPANDPTTTHNPARARKGAVAIILAFAAGGLLLYGLGRLVVAPESSISNLAGTPAVAADAGGFSEEQRKSIEKIVKDYLIANPEVFLEVQGALEAKMEKEQAEKMKAMVAANAKDLYRHPNAAVAGNPNGDITVVEFFDYNCGYCKRALGDVAKLIEKDKNIRVVFADLPIIRDESEPVSRVALAAKLQGKYWEVHRDLLATKGLVTEAIALKIAEKAGLDMTKLKTDMNSAEVKGELERVKDLAKKMGINGTPHFLVGDRSIGGAPENLFEMLETHAGDLRKSGCNYC
jgi:protein-disulfide isomerase